MAELSPEQMEQLREYYKRPENRPGPMGFRNPDAKPSSVGRTIRNFLAGTPEKRENVSTLRPEQENLYNQLLQSGQGPGAGGAFGTSADYYRNLLGDNNTDMQAFAAPELRRYNEEIIPGLSEQFAGMGAGGLSSSGFRNAQVQGATDLSERLAQMRANLRQSGAQGLTNIGHLGLNPYSQNMTTEQGSPGFLQQIAPALGSAAGAYFGGPIGASIGNSVGNAVGNLGSGAMNSSRSGNNVGANSSPYGGGYQMPKLSASPEWSYNPR